MNIEITKIRDAIKNGIPLVVRRRHRELFIFALRALVSNAKKANFKRAHFDELALRINDKVTFLVRNDIFYFSVKNNVPPTQDELRDLQNQISWAWRLWC